MVNKSMKEMIKIRNSLCLKPYFLYDYKLKLLNLKLLQNNLLKWRWHKLKP